MELPIRWSRSARNQPTPTGKASRRRDLTQSSLTEDFLYDNRNRLTSASIQGGGVSGIVTSTVTYDAIGNILTKTGVGTYTYNATTYYVHPNNVGG